MNRTGYGVKQERARTTLQDKMVGTHEGRKINSYQSEISTQPSQRGQVS